METIDKTPQKKNKDFIWLGIGMVGFIAALILLKVLMTHFGLIG
ncbi:hypothetical protein [Sunxiuqinia dokdonensis]|uniref:Uncharacterized protein n=1 Tax=Sunxiuqinia dokdonensis TaxID=1409788 RepID=A0A0L8V895_9BACT|nr:hypothetical protein [Sunxiuqinia dokdonensis]KOH44690.1 hypothetical protein NC99_24750 [Sunxiuqinia dokdonensis]